ncbi:hypothetical protein D3C75_470130 [compost metagenome]
MLQRLGVITKPHIFDCDIELVKSVPRVQLQLLLEQAEIAADFILSGYYTVSIAVMVNDHRTKVHGCIRSSFDNCSSNLLMNRSLEPVLRAAAEHTQNRIDGNDRRGMLSPFMIMNSYKKRFILHMLCTQQQLPLALRIQLLIGIEHENPRPARLLQTGVTCGCEVSGPGKRDNCSAKAAGNCNRVIRRARIDNNQLICSSAYTGKTPCQVVGFILYDHAKRDQRLSLRLTHGCTPP